MSVKQVQAIVNGQTYTLTFNSNTGKYEATVTAPNKSSYSQSGHYYGITIKATDDAGNVTTKDATDSAIGSSLRLTVKEKVAPVITVTNPTASATLVNNKPTITWSVTDDDSGVNPDTIGITIDGGSKITDGITKTATSNGYNCSYSPSAALSDNSHTIRFDASDYDGNAASQKSVTFKIDTVPPTLSISSPSDGYVTNKNTITVSGTTNDATSSPVTVTVNGKQVTMQSIAETILSRMSHNIPRLAPKDITSYYNDGSLWKRLNGTGGYSLFEDIYVGDYFKMSRAISAPNPDASLQLTGSQYVTIAGIDSLYGNGDSNPVTYHHLVMVPGQGFGGTQHFGRSRMNPTNTTVGGYKGSEMNTKVIGNVATAGSTSAGATINQQLFAEFGSRLKTTRELVSNRYEYPVPVIPEMQDGS